MTEIAELKQWIDQAYELGKGAANATASWITDGNESDDSRRRKLQAIVEGDMADEYLPVYPNLSGEWAGDPTPHSLVTEVTGRTDFGGQGDYTVIEEALVKAWEEGVDDTFLPACEAELRRWIGGPSGSEPATVED